MSDPFRRLFLDQVDLIVQREPSRESLLALLQLATPGLRSLGNGDETQRAFKTLMARVHPDKHPQDSPRATRLCQDAQAFYRSCLRSPTSGRKRSRQNADSSRNASLPHEFMVVSKWPHVAVRNLAEHLSQQARVKEHQIPRAVAYQCINARGAIAHGRQIELKHQVASDDPVMSVEQVFNLHGGSKMLSYPDDIKEELMANGPVVSTSFHPNDAFRSTIQFCQKDLLIAGWKQLPSGEVWIVQPLNHNRGTGFRFGSQNPSSHIAIGQFGIDDCCLAPTNNFEDTPWQKGPYYNVRIGKDQENWWKSPPHPVSPLSPRINNMTVEMESMSELDPLFKGAGTTCFPSASFEGIVVTVRDRSKRAHSKRATLASIKWDAGKGKFVVRFDFNEGEALNGDRFGRPKNPTFSFGSAGPTPGFGAGPFF